MIRFLLSRLKASPAKTGEAGKLGLAALTGLKKFRRPQNSVRVTFSMGQASLMFLKGKVTLSLKSSRSPGGDPPAPPGEGNCPFPFPIPSPEGSDPRNLHNERPCGRKPIRGRLRRWGRSAPKSQPGRASFLSDSGLTDGLAFHPIMLKQTTHFPPDSVFHNQHLFSLRLRPQGFFEGAHPEGALSSNKSRRRGNEIKHKQAGAVKF